MENAPQLMMAPGVLVMMRLLPLDLNVAVPDTTVGLPGLAWTIPAKQEATATVMSFCRQGVLRGAGLESSFNLDVDTLNCEPDVRRRRRTANGRPPIGKHYAAKKGADFAPCEMPWVNLLRRE